MVLDDSTAHAGIYPEAMRRASAYESTCGTQLSKTKAEMGVRSTLLQVRRIIYEVATMNASYIISDIILDQFDIVNSFKCVAFSCLYSD